MSNFLNNKTVSKVLTTILSAVLIAGFLYVGKAEAKIRGTFIWPEYTHEMCHFDPLKVIVYDVVRTSPNRYLVSFGVRSNDSRAHCVITKENLQKVQFGF